MKSCRKICVLLVDDNDEFLGLCHELLISSIHEIEIVCASSVVQATKYLKSNPGKVDIVISDYQMPHGNGSLILKYIKDNKFHIPFVLMSSLDYSECLELNDMNVDGYINKNDLAGKIADTVGYLIDQRNFEFSPEQDHSNN